MGILGHFSYVKIAFSFVSLLVGSLVSPRWRARSPGTYSFTWKFTFRFQPVELGLAHSRTCLSDWRATHVARGGVPAPGERSVVPGVRGLWPRLLRLFPYYFPGKKHLWEGELAAGLRTAQRQPPLQKRLRHFLSRSISCSKNQNVPRLISFNAQTLGPMILAGSLMSLRVHIFHGLALQSENTLFSHIGVAPNRFHAILQLWYHRILSTN